MSNFIKNFFSNRYARIITAWACHFYIYLVYKTSKIIVKNDCESIFKYLELGNGVVLITWHGRSLISPIGLKSIFKKEIENGRKIVVLSSIHRDGKIAASIMATFGIGVIEGSTINPKKGSSKNKKSMTSLRSTMKALKDGTICVLAPDGPRGPAFKMNTKITEIVKRIETGIACISISYKNKKKFNTWDRFELPYPFGTILIDYSEVTTIKSNDNVNEINNLLEMKLNEMIEKGDKEVASL